MNKYFQSLYKGGSHEFKISEKWGQESKRENESTHSVICDLRSEQASSLKQLSGRLNKELKGQKFQVLEEEIYKKSFELSCYKNKFCETISHYEKKIKDMHEILMNTILSVNEILQNLQQNCIEVEEFQDGEDSNDHPQKEHKISQYLETKLQLISKEIKQYTKSGKYEQLNEYAQKQQKKIDELINYIHKKNQYTDKLKKKIQTLRTQRNTTRQELEQVTKVIQEVNSLETNLDLKYVNRKDLTQILKSLLRRIVFHEKHCKEAKKLTSEEILKVNKTARMNSDQKGKSGSSSSPTKMSHPPKSPSKKFSKMILTLE